MDRELIILIVVMLIGAVILGAAFGGLLLILNRVHTIIEEEQEIQKQGCEIHKTGNCTIISKGFLFDIADCEEYIICMNGTATPRVRRTAEL